MSILNVAVSSRALFDLIDGHEIFVNEGWGAFDEYMRRNELKPLRKGVAFNTVKKLLALNTPGRRDKVEVTLLSSNTPQAGARVVKSVRHYELDINRAFFTSGGDRCKLAKAGKINLFLSTNPGEVRKALAEGIPAACVMPTSRMAEQAHSEALCIAFDGDAVLFSDEAERINQAEGLSAFNVNETTHAAVPLGDGPLKPVLAALKEIQAMLIREGHKDLLRVALVTARGMQVSERVMNTFRSWGIHMEDAYFLDGAAKGPYLEALGASLFLDDGMHNIESALPFVPSCHVPHGVVGTREASVTAAEA